MCLPQFGFVTITLHFATTFTIAMIQSTNTSYFFFFSLHIHEDTLQLYLVTQSLEGKKKGKGNIKAFFKKTKEKKGKKKRKGTTTLLFSLGIITFQPFPIDGIHQVSAIRLSQMIISTLMCLPYHKGSFPLRCKLGRSCHASHDIVCYF